MADELAVLDHRPVVHVAGPGGGGGGMGAPAGPDIGGPGGNTASLAEHIRSS